MVALARKSQPPDDETAVFAADVLRGLAASPKRLSPKYFYDDAGSILFERITELPEYYPTRCEMSILRTQASRDRRADSAGRGAGRIRRRRRPRRRASCWTPRRSSPPTCRSISAAR